jgi:pimeloyl-ACP methyl ester carboxylesterase
MRSHHLRAPRGINAIAALVSLAACTACTATPSAAMPATSPISPSPSASATAPQCGSPPPSPFLYLPSDAPWGSSILILGTGSRGVVLGGQANGGICQTLPYAQHLVSRGYHVALFDWSAAGDHQANLTTATQALLHAGARHVVVGGFSRGALIALGAAPTLGKEIVGVISVSGGPSATDGFPTIESLARYPGPLLLISSTNDPFFPPGTSAAIAAAHPGPETVLLLPGSDHALALLDGPNAKSVNVAIDAFLTRLLA